MTQFTTHTQLIIDTTRRLRQVPGTQTQLYSETVIASYIQEAYYILKAEAWWPWLMKRLVGTLDGTTGVVTGTPWATGGLTDFEDIRAVYLNNFNQRLPKVGEHTNTGVTPGLYGTTNVARMIEPLSIHDDPTSVLLFRVYPLDTVGSVYVWCRADPASLFTNPAVVVPMNKYLLMNYVMWRYMTDDAANPGAAAAALQAYEKIKEQEMEKCNDEPVQLNAGVWHTNDQWQDV